MHLKTLTIKGFKSFASSTTLRLEPGITAVVGPNGSGKSNVVDALTWVMGEQGAKNLRGGSMADVIFAGAGGRAPLGRAEVSLTIDNADGALPIDYTEVTITRTLFRGGGSEYQVNGTSCRLLDVQELLSDTGLGRQMHVIVGQGRLDEVLSATPEERRGFIEEAAGVLKHRRRKERALRKLDAMAADLSRLNDLTAELRRQLGPLARQAAVARRARSIQVEVRDATARLLADDVAQSQSLLQAGDEDQALLTRRRAAAEERERVARARLAELHEQEATSSQRLARASAVWEELTSVAQSLTSLSEVAAERARGLASAPPPAQGADPEELEQRAATAQAEETALADALEAARTSLSEASRARADTESAELTAHNALSGLQRRQAEHREKVARAGGRVASARSRHEAALAALAQARGAVASAQQRADAAQAATQEHARASVQSSARDEPGQGADDRDPGGGTGAGTAGGPGAGTDPEQRPVDHQARASAAHEAATLALTRARDAVSLATDARREASSERAAWTARRDTLALSLRAQDGTAALAEAGLEGVLGPLSEVLSVERGWENAVAALLGELAGAVLVQGPDAALSALEHARAQDSGALHLVLASGEAPADQDREHRAQVAQDAAREVEAAQVARALVSVQLPDLEASLDHLLAGAVVVPDLAAARAARRACPEAVVATREGDVLAPTWATAAGRGTSSVLELAAAHEDARARARAATLAEEQADVDLQAARSSEEQARHAVSQALNALRAADAEAARQAEVLASLTSAARAARQEADRARRVLERAETESAQRTTELASAVAALSEVEDGSPGAQGAEADLDAALAKTQQDREDAVQAARQARATETEARLSLRTAEERERSARGRSISLRAAARREREQRAAAQRAEARRLARLRTATHVRDQARLAAQVAQDSVAQAQAERAAVDSERSAALAATSEVRQELDQVTSELSRLTDAAHRDEIARAEQRIRLQALADRAMNELGVELDALVEEYGPHMPVPLVSDDPDDDLDEDAGPEEDVPGEGASEDEAQSGTSRRRRPAGRPYVRAEQERRLARASRDLTRLGKVNPLALEEHAALEQRHQFLAEQLGDLRRSRADLLSIVEEIDARVQEVFTQAYQDTACEFGVVFDRLFPGGEGRLVLTDPDNMLTTGIEIEARPAGKKVKRLSLLSGGERSLAAVALLVAIFKARPSPFYVMDEVEAALDDTNLGRLLEIFTELRESSQLIIITHQKRTMEVADALYGITMREGVTKAVSQRLAPRQERGPKD